MGPERLWGTRQWARGQGLPPVQKHRNATVKSEGGDRSRRGQKWDGQRQKEKTRTGWVWGFSPGDRGGGQETQRKKAEDQSQYCLQLVSEATKA